MSQAAAAEILRTLSDKPTALITLPTGNTPTETYAVLTPQKNNGQPFSRLRLFKLDEWGGLPLEHPSTCESYLRQHVIGPWELREEQVLTYDSNPADPDQECSRINKLLEKIGPLDLCVLGLGANGHLALNEPNDFLQPFAHVAALTEKSRQHSMLQAAGASGKIYGMTLGIAQVLQARKIILLVSGASKLEQMRKLREASISTQFPGSFLWLHSNTICFCDIASFGPQT
jgi:galactosamine-6-phosphate isomerase